MTRRDRQRKPPEISDEEILTFLREGLYRVDIENAKVYGKDGIEIKQESSGDRGTYRCIRIKNKGKRRKIAVHTIVWMAGTDSVKPKGWQVHHRDEDSRHNAFKNLMCLHPLDHTKFHETDDTPF